MPPENSKIIHSSCVALKGRGLLILGHSGAGKSSLALQLMALGADLVSDDQTILTSDGTQLYAKAPASIGGLIEARGVGILTVDCVSDATVAAVVDLDQLEKERLPPFRELSVLGISVTCLHKVDSPVFPFSLLHYLNFGRQNVI